MGSIMEVCPGVSTDEVTALALGLELELGLAEIRFRSNVFLNKCSRSVKNLGSFLMEYSDTS